MGRFSRVAFWLLLGVMAGVSSWAAPAREVILAVAGCAGDAVSSGDCAEMMASLPRIHEAVKEVRGDIEVRAAPLESLDDLGKSLGARIEPGENLRGIVFMGHGSSTAYALSEGKRYTGDEVANRLLEALPKLPVNGELIVYFNGCSIGSGLVESERSFYGTFLKTIEDARPWVPGSFAGLRLITHVQTSMTSSLRPAGFVARALVASGAPRALDRFFHNVGERVGLGTTAMLVATALGANLAGKIVFHGDEPLLLSVAVTGFLTTAVLAGGKVSRSARLSSEGRSEESGFAYDQLVAALRASVATEKCSRALAPPTPLP